MSLAKRPRNDKQQYTILLLRTIAGIFFETKSADDITMVIKHRWLRRNMNDKLCDFILKK